jgi:hypothetical protein
MLGDRGLATGLIDGLEDLDSLVRRIGGEKAVTRRFIPRRRGFLRMLPGAMANALLDALEERQYRIQFR